MASRGFTLLELMVAVAVVAILATIAYPSYENYLLKSRRRAAEACLMELAQWMERYYTTNMAYCKLDPSNPANCATPKEPSLPLLGCRTELKDASNGADADAYYEFQFASGEPTKSTFKIEAIPKGRQQNDACGTLSVDHLGGKGATGSGSGQGCW